jgi:endonuclease III
MARKAIYSKDLGIDLRSGQERDLFKWFLACLLFGKPIQQEVARRTYLEFAEKNLLTPEAILEAGWDRLVEVLDRGHYVRYDFSTATKLLEVCRKLNEEYGGLGGLIAACRNKADLSRRLQQFKGIGPTTARIFLRDLRMRPASTKIKSGALRRRSVRNRPDN